MNKQTHVNCDVKNCAYHSGENYCTASTIQVGPNNADSKSDTLCTTFSDEK